MQQDERSLKNLRNRCNFEERTALPLGTWRGDDEITVRSSRARKAVVVLDTDQVLVDYPRASSVTFPNPRRPGKRELPWALTSILRSCGATSNVM
jgi:hypothetical protein